MSVQQSSVKRSSEHGSSLKAGLASVAKTLRDRPSELRGPFKVKLTDGSPHKQ